MTQYEGENRTELLQENPFEITKAADFTDSEISKMWVDWPGPGGFAQFVHLTSPMARIVLGGKGTGRTHLMRHYSAPVQSIRGGDNSLSRVIDDGVLGIYVLCSGLNARRFRGRGIDDDVWQSVFAQFVDLWLAQAALEAFAIVAKLELPSREVQASITAEVRNSLEEVNQAAGNSLADLANDLYQLQRTIDYAVNNAGLQPGKPTTLKISSNSGSLVFGVPLALRKHYQPLRDITFVYLIDEFENFDKPQQQYIQSLIRERRVGTSFMIGVRTYGLRTLETLSGGEENKRGSEFEEIRLDRQYAVQEKDRYAQFCTEVVAKRLVERNHISKLPFAPTTQDISAFFEAPDSHSEERLILERYSSRERPYFARLRSQLASVSTDLEGDSLTSRNIESIIDAVRVPSRPLLEKVNVLLIYRAWAGGKNLVALAEEIRDSCQLPDASGIVPANSGQREVLDHFVTDLKAQLCQDLRQHPTYAGFEDFIDMSEGLPRNLLVILKSIYKWAVFRNEQPFLDGKMSLQSQSIGVLEAARWFLEDATPLGEEGKYVAAAIHRLGEMFRRLRFSDKPVESSLASFSADLTSCTQRAREIVELAEKWSLLTEVDRGQRDRNTKLVEAKFHFNRLLSPLYDLPIARRGALKLSAKEMNAIFDPAHVEQFNAVLNQRLRRMNAPFGKRKYYSRNQSRFRLEE